MTSNGSGNWDGHMMNTPFGGLMMVLIVAAIAYFVFISMRSSNRKDGNDSPLEILKQRYARGEIDKETYARMKEEIENGKR
ncbi:SHOCT domain-containing protein [Pseudodesulfovibrio cashew]|uniref:SHOCT domain-containing protein n=2 Tax=Pseudodesulfovibrio cashew TaxID=2678688 RepID=A0A6I6JM27_9BACT|nr:SHOCT domain-containing protein [Pseudodesulfovibrio cashew]